MKTYLMNVCARHDPRTCKIAIEKWNISCLLPSSHRMLLLSRDYQGKGVNTPYRSCN